jgi:predicted GTPase
LNIGKNGKRQQTSEIQYVATSTLSTGAKYQSSFFDKTKTVAATENPAFDFSKADRMCGKTLVTAS